MVQPLPAYRGDEPYVFVSYSHADEKTVLAEIRWLQDQGIKVWFDATGIGAGSEWHDEIARAIQGATHFLYFVTPHAVASEHCRRELNFAQSEQKRVVAAHLQSTDMPPGLRLSLDNRQAILKFNLTTASYRNALIDALQHGELAALEPSRATRFRNWSWLVGAGSIVAVTAAIASLWFATTREPVPVARQLTRLMSGETILLSPALSPDGTMLAYVSEWKELSDIWVRRTEGGDSIRITETPVIEGSPVFSPSGEQLAFTRFDGSTDFSIWVVPALGGPARRVVTSGTQPAWSPDASKIAFVLRREQHNPVVATVDLETGKIAEVSATEYPDHVVYSPTWSTDGDTIAYIKSSGGVAGELWSVSLRGGPARRVLQTESGVFVHAPEFVPESDVIVFSSSMGGAVNLWSVRADGSDLTQLTFGPGPDRTPSVDRHGNVVFQNASWRNELVTIDLATGKSTKLLAHEPYLWAPAFSPDDAQVVFSRGETDGSWNVWAIGVDGSSPRRITSGDAPQMRPKFTPDGEHLMYFTWTPPESVYVTKLDGSETRRIEIAAPNASYPTMSPDGTTIAFTQAFDDRVGMYTVPIHGGEPDRLTETPGTVAEWSPDGRRIAFAANRSLNANVYVIDADGSNEQLIAENAGWPVWWPDGEHVLVRSLDDKLDQYIRKISLATGRETRLTDYQFHGANFPIAVNSTGTLLVTSNAFPDLNQIWLLRAQR